MSGDDHRLVESRIVFDGRRIRVRCDRLLDGQGREFVRETVEHPGAVVIVPVLPDGKIVMVRQYRYPIGELLLELPAGTLEPGEEPVATAARELAEETGFRAGKLSPLGIVYPSPGILSEKMHFYLATELESGEPDRDPGEDIEVRLLEPREAFRAIRAGEIRDGKTVVGLHLALGEMREDDRPGMSDRA